MFDFWKEIILDATVLLLQGGVSRSDEVVRVPLINHCGSPPLHAAHDFPSLKEGSVLNK